MRFILTALLDKNIGAKTLAPMPINRLIIKGFALLQNLNYSASAANSSAT